MKSLDFRIRKLHVNSEPDRRLQKAQPSRVYVAEDALLELTGSKDGGRAVRVEKVAGSGSGSGSSQAQQHEATLWKAPEKLDKAVTQLYDAFRTACGFSLGDQVRVTVLGGGIADAACVTLRETTTTTTAGGAGEGKEGKDKEQNAVRPVDVPHWEYMLGLRLTDQPEQHVYAGMLVRIALGATERTFVVAEVDGRASGNARYRHEQTSLRIVESFSAAGSKAAEDDNCGGKTAAAAPTATLQIRGVKGLDPQVRKINDYLSCFDRALPTPSPVGAPGLVIHGSHGTGKTMLLNRIAESGWARAVYRIQPRDKLAEVQETLRQALQTVTTATDSKEREPGVVVVIDQLEQLIDKERSNRGAVVLALCEAFDALFRLSRTRGSRPRVVIVASCLDLAADVAPELRDPGRLAVDVYLPTPDPDARRAILASFWPGSGSGPPESLRDTLHALGDRTHAYNGKDLQRLFIEAHANAEMRMIREMETEATEATNNSNDTTDTTDATDTTELPPVTLHPSDFEKALHTIRPSVMHDINLKPPPIRWSDIAGQEAVKQALQDAVRLTLAPRALVTRLMGAPPKGYLLYGPPGCSKTMAAQALATEAGFNFFAVKGAELLNMYVGESERAVRRLFEHARQAAPSIIFFDEMDTIAGARHGFSHQGGTNGGSSSSSSSSGNGGGIHVVATLLTEMDGFEALEGVLVLASTNRPHAIDPALLRPGRFSKLIFVGPPDAQARRAMLLAERGRRAWAADVDLDVLVGRTEGCSGAEVKAVCVEAGQAAFRRVARGVVVGPGAVSVSVSVSGSTSGSSSGSSGAAKVADAFADAMADAVITMADLLDAVGAQKRQVTPQMLDEYARWENQFRRG